MKNYVATFARLPATAHFPKAGWPLVPAKEEGGLLKTVLEVRSHYMEVGGDLVICNGDITA